MIDLLERVDPAAKVEVDKENLRARIDERLGISGPVVGKSRRRPWMVAAIGFAAVLAVIIPLTVGETTGDFDQAFADTLHSIPGVIDSVALPDGPTDMAASDGTIWVATSTTGELLRINAETAVVEARYSVPGTVEDIHVGGGYVWLEGPDGPGRFDPTTGQFTEVAPAEVLTSRSSFDPIDLDGTRWATDGDDYTLTRIPIDGEGTFAVVPMPARPNSMVYESGSLWIALHQAGTLLRFDPRAELPAPVAAVVDEVFGRIRLLCTGTGGGPTILLDPDAYGGWGLGAGSWSLVQHELSKAATVCSYDPRGTYAAPEGPQGDSSDRVTDLAAALDTAGVEGPYVLVAHGHGVFSSRLFHQLNPDDIAGMVLVDPIPMGYTEFHNGLLPEVDLEPDDTPLMDGVGDLDDVPLTVIGHDPEATFLHEGFLGNPGSTPEIAAQLNDFWQEGLGYYAGLSTNSTQLTARNSNHVVIWYRPDLVVEAVSVMLDDLATS